MSIRHYSLTGTVATTTAAPIPIPANVKINYLIITQATADFIVYFASKDGTTTKSSMDETKSDKTYGSNYTFNLQTMSRIELYNSHASETLTYLIVGEEYLS